MPLDYRYEAVDAAGRRLNGTLTADSEKDARRKLFEQGLVVSKLQGEAKAKTSWDWRHLFQKRLSTSELILFTQQFRTLYIGKSRLGWGITPQPGVKPASSRA